MSSEWPNLATPGLALDSLIKAALGGQFSRLKPTLAPRRLMIVDCSTVQTEGGNGSLLMIQNYVYFETGEYAMFC